MKKKQTRTKKPTLMHLSMQPENLAAAGPGRGLCQKCGRFKGAESSFVKPWIPEDWSEKVLVVSPVPEVSDGFVRPLKNKAVRILRSLFHEAGFGDNDIAFVTAVSCSGDPPNMDQIRCCRPFLLRSLDELTPKNVLGLGKYALKALSNTNNQNITKARGKNIEVKRGDKL